MKPFGGPPVEPPDPCAGPPLGAASSSDRVPTEAAGSPYPLWPLPLTAPTNAFGSAGARSAPALVEIRLDGMSTMALVPP